MLNSLSKHGIVVGVVTFLISSMVIISELPTVRYILLSDAGYVNPFMYKAQHMGIMLLALTGETVSCLLLWGIAKKRHTLFVPWLVFHFLAFVLTSFAVFYDCLSRSYTTFDDFIFSFIVVGSGVILIYPIHILYIGIHSINMLNSPGIKC